MANALQVMATINSTYYDLPFLQNSSAINYIKTSKLMVLAPASQDEVFQKISNTYGTDATCLTDCDESKQIAAASEACSNDHHVVAISIGDFEDSNVSHLAPFTQLSLDHNYIVSLVNEPETLLPQYVGWHFNEADSCMLGLCAHALLDDLLRTIPEFCSDFRNISGSETIPEMLKYYQLASSNHNGMLHCTAKYLGDDPGKPEKDYFGMVKGDLTMSYETSVIGLVFTPRTFGARVKLSAEQLRLWGGDDEAGKTSVKPKPIETNHSDKTESKIESKENDDDPLSVICSAMSESSIHSASEHSSTRSKDYSMSVKKKSTRYFPHCQASLAYLTANATEEPDFHPVTGLGRKAHLTIGVANDVSAVVTGYDLLEVVALEAQQKDWPTYHSSRGWLRDYGEGRWVLYMNSKITVDTLFAGVYVQ